jgi:SAM-dependent methyltransferase
VPGEVRCESAEVLPDGRLTSPSAERNREPIVAVLERVLPHAGLVLEIASGTGQHVVHFARRLPHLAWQPSDPGAACRRSIVAWTAAEALHNVHAPLDLDVQILPWPVPAPVAVVCINMLHIAPWSAAGSLFRGAAAVLRPGGLLFLYGPFVTRDRPTAASNLEFDRTLRAANPAWGLRELEAVVGLATRHDFAHAETVDMPANNLSVLFRRRRAADPGMPTGGS